METGGAMSAKMIQEKCGRREKQWRFAPGALALLNAALDVWGLSNGFPAGQSMGETIRADFAERHSGRAGH